MGSGRGQARRAQTAVPGRGRLEKAVNKAKKKFLHERHWPRFKQEVGDYDFGDGNGPVPSHRHINPEHMFERGGWVANTATVEAEVIVEEHALVYGNATVGYGSPQIHDHARVYGNAVVKHWSIVRGNAHVYENAVVGGNARIDSNARVYGNAVIGEACLGGDVDVCGDAKLMDRVGINEGHYDGSETASELAELPRLEAEQLTF